MSGPGHRPATSPRRTPRTTPPQHGRAGRAGAVPAGAGADGDDPGAPRQRAARLRQPAVGRAALRIWFALLIVAAGCLVAAAVHHEFAFWLVSDLAALQAVRIALMALAVGWAALFFDAWRLGQPLTLRMSHRRAAVGINGILCFSVAAVLLFGAHLVGVQRDFIQTMFGSGDATGAHDGRYNVLLLGGDSGVDRWGLRPDSITVASIDAETGHTVLVSLPRNMQNFPFAKGSVMHQQFPQGLRLRALHAQRRQHLGHGQQGAVRQGQEPRHRRDDLGGRGDHRAEDQLLGDGQPQGVPDLVDAVGGVTLNVRQRIPIGGLGSDVYDYIEPGKQKLTGFQTQWYARARDGSDDYSRMARQKCVMAAMLDQLDPTDRAQELPEDRQGQLGHGQTSIPASEVDRFIGLAIKARDQKISTLSIVPPMFDTYEPDARLIRQKVAEAIDAAEGNAPKKAAGRPTTDGTKKPGKASPKTPTTGHRRLGRLAERGVRRQRVPGPRHRLLRQPAAASARIVGART